MSSQGETRPQASTASADAARQDAASEDSVSEDPANRDAASQDAPRRRGLLGHYSPGEERPLGAYMALTTLYAAASAGSLLGLRATGRSFPERPRAGDIVLVGIASHKISRLIAKDKVTSFVRAPFTRFQESSGQGEVEEEPCGHGLRLAVGELLVCPYCLSQWIATGLTFGLVAAPRFTRLMSTIYVAHTISDFLQVAYRAAEDNV